MAYCSTAEVQARFPTAGTELAAVIAGYITISDAEIDSILRGARYATPISGTVPDVIKELSILKTGVKLLDILYERQNSQVDGAYIVDLKRIISEMEDGIKTRKILPKIALIDMSPDAMGDSLTTPDVSQHALPDGFELITEDMND
jgi:hypothetical protein